MEDPEPDPGLIRVGRIGRPHGVRGEVTVLAETDDPYRFAPDSRLTGTAGTELVVLRSRPYRDRGLVVAFDGFADRSAAETLRGTILFAPATARSELPPGEYWSDQLVGLVAVSPDGAMLGEVAAVESGGPQDRLVVITPDGRAVLVPFVDAIVGDPIAGRIEIRDPGGLF